MTTCEKIKRARTRAGLKQKELGDMVYLSQMQISSYETGRNRVTVDALCAIAKALDVPAASLLGSYSQRRL